MTLQKQEAALERSDSKDGVAPTEAAWHEGFAAARLDYFESRCNLLADRVRADELAFIDGVDLAYSAAQWSGLVDAVGDDSVQMVLRAAFMNVPRGMAS